MRGPPAQVGRAGRDPDGGTRAVRLIRELRVTVSRRGRDRTPVGPARREREGVPRAIRGRLPDTLRGNRDLAGGQDCETAGRRNRRGDHRVLRQACAVPRVAFDPPAAARHRPSGHLPGEDRARREGDP